jgi:hypothetical protein
LSCQRRHLGRPFYTSFLQEPWSSGLNHYWLPCSNRWYPVRWSWELVQFHLCNKSHQHPNTSTLALPWS